MTIKGDPDEVMKAAHAVLAEPYGYIDRVHATIDGPCRLPAMAFGIAPSIVLSGPYEDARNLLATTSKEAAATFKSMATGLGNVAHAMGGAEAANTLVPTKSQLQPTGISSDGSDRSGTQASVMVAEVMLLAEWIAAGGVIAACGALAPSALAAMASWILVQPDDASLSQAISGWQSAAQDVDSASKYLDLALKPLDSGWPDEDTSRQAFDKWKIPFGQDVDGLKDATGKLGDALSEAVNSVHDVQTDVFITASICLASIIALTALDAVPFMAAVAEPMKEAVGAVLDIDVAANVLVVVSVVKTIFDALKGMLGTAEGFKFDKPGDHTIPHFTQLHIDWDHE